MFGHVGQIGSSKKGENNKTPWERLTLNLEWVRASGSNLSCLLSGALLTSTTFSSGRATFASVHHRLLIALSLPFLTMANHTKSASISTPTLYDSTVSPPSSPFNPSARPTHKARRPSLSNTMSKLKDSLNHSHLIDGLQHKRAHSHSRAHDGPYKGLQISEPKLAGSLDQLAPPRLGPLGSGATIVRTPQEALTLASARSTASTGTASSSSTAPYYRVQASTSAPSRIHVYHPAPVEEEDGELPPSPKSPPLPPLPTSPQSQNAPDRFSHSRRSAGSSQASSSRIFPPAPPAPTTQLPLTPDVSPSMQNRASLKSQEERASRTSSRPKSRAGSSRSRSSWSMLQLTPDLLEAAPQAPFAPVLMSNLPANMQKVDASRTIVILETSTSTVKTTLKTLTSRNSFLETYLVELIGSTSTSSRSPTISDRAESLAEGDGESVYSQRSEFHDSDVDEEDGFNSLFQEHLAVSGIMKPQRPKRRADGTASIHVFLDRPSTPYVTICFPVLLLKSYPFVQILAYSVLSPCIYSFPSVRCPPIPDHPWLVLSLPARDAS